MHPWREIAYTQTTLDRGYMRQILADESCTGTHESVLRSFQLLRLVKDLLEKETPPSVVLDIINFIEDVGETQ